MVIGMMLRWTGRRGDVMTLGVRIVVRVSRFPLCSRRVSPSYR
jgi:hypothetical protein